MPDTDLAMRLAVEGTYLVVLLSAPPMLAAALTALIVSLVGKMTKVHDATLGNVPKALAGLIALLIAAPWIAKQVVEFGRLVLLAIPELTL